MRATVSSSEEGWTEMGRRSYRAVPSGDDRPRAFESLPSPPQQPESTRLQLCPLSLGPRGLGSLHQGRHLSSLKCLQPGVPCLAIASPLPLSSTEFWPPAGRSHSRRDIGSTCPEQPLQHHRRSKHELRVPGGARLGARGPETSKGASPPEARTPEVPHTCESSPRRRMHGRLRLLAFEGETRGGVGGGVSLPVGQGIGCET